MTTEGWKLADHTGGVRSRKVADLVASRMRKIIASGELKEGDWLPTEPELTAQFGVSRPTLREAFRLLEADGLVQIRRGPPGGARVTLPGPENAASLFGLILTLSGTTLKDVYEARLLLEPPAARILAEASDPACIEQLRESLVAVEQAVNDDELFASLTTRFHVEVVRLAGNHTLAAVAGMLREITARHIALGYRESRRRPAELAANNRRAARSYEKFISLVESGKADEAEAHWRKHMEAALTFLMDDIGAVAHDVIDVLD
jgi:DNA-binding FadR family transcriptional regulator